MVEFEDFRVIKRVNLVKNARSQKKTVPNEILCSTWIMRNGKNTYRNLKLKKIVHEIFVKKLWTNFQILTALESWLEVCTIGAGLSQNRKKKRQRPSDFWKVKKIGKYSKLTNPRKNPDIYSWRSSVLISNLYSNKKLVESLYHWATIAKKRQGLSDFQKSKKWGKNRNSKIQEKYPEI